MKPKKVDFFLIVMLLATLLSLIDAIVRLTKGESFTSDLFAIALFGYLTIEYWKYGTVGGKKP